MPPDNTYNNLVTHIYKAGGLNARDGLIYYTIVYFLGSIAGLNIAGNAVNC